MRAHVFVMLVLFGVCGGGEAAPKVNPIVEKAMSAAIADGEKAYAAYMAAVDKASEKAVKDLEKAKAEAKKKGDLPSVNEMDVKIKELKEGGLDAMLSSLRTRTAPSERVLTGMVDKPAWADSFGKDKYGTWADLKVAGLTQRFLWIWPGTFTMGSSKAERDAAMASVPGSQPALSALLDAEVQHQVTLTQGFWLADSACTQAFWQAVMGNNPSKCTGDANQPVEQVSWDDCQKFISALNGRVSGGGFSLPSEAQWEYACRAGTTTAFSFGATITPAQVNYDGNYPFGGVAKGLYRQKPVPVKSLPPNAWGLYEMHGNVWQWCNDWFADSTSDAAHNPTGPSSGSDRVGRGGSWDSSARHCRAADRGRFSPSYRDKSMGFRLAAPATP